NNLAQGSSVLADLGWYAPGGVAAGGGVYSSGDLTMTGCIVRNNAAVGGRGADGANSSNGGLSPGSQNPARGPPGGDASGGGVRIAAGTADITGTTGEQNGAKGGVGGKGMKWAPQGEAGIGLGGGIFIAPEAGAGIDAFTVTHTRKNHASTADPNIS